MMNYSMDNKGEVGPKTIIAIVLTSIFTIFILQNTEIVEISFLFWHMSLSRVILLFGLLLIGVLIGLFIGWEIFSKNKTDRPKKLID